MEDIMIKIKDWNSSAIKLAFPKKDYISLEELVSKFEDIYNELDSLEEEFEDYKQNIADNYTQISVKEQVE